MNEGTWDEEERDDEENEYYFIDFDVYDAAMNCFPFRMELNRGLLITFYFSFLLESYKAR